MHTITIFDEKRKPLSMFPAPPDTHAAKELWIFLVENLQPRMIVELTSFNGAAELTRPTGQKVPEKLYKSLVGDSREI